MGETHAYTRELDRFGPDKVLTSVARSLRETEIAATQVKCTAPTHQLTTFISRGGFLLAWPLRDLPLSASWEDGGPQALIRSSKRARLTR